jgi:hypothetical protein
VVYLEVENLRNCLWFRLVQQLGTIGKVETPIAKVIIGNSEVFIVCFTNSTLSQQS